MCSCNIREEILKEIEYHKFCIQECLKRRDKSNIPKHATAIKLWNNRLDSLDDMIEQAKIDARRNTITEIESILSII